MKHKGYKMYVDGLLMPIAPMEYKIKIKNKNKVVSLLNGNDLNLIKGAGLTEITAKIRLPSEDFPAVQNYQNQRVFLDKFESLKSNDKKKKVVHFILLREFPNREIDPIRFDMVTVEDYQADEDSRMAGDIIVTLNLKKYIPAPVAKLEDAKVNEDGTTSRVIKVSDRPTSRPVQEYVTVKANETLNEYAKRVTGDAKNADSIAKKNNITDWNNLEAGKVLQL